MRRHHLRLWIVEDNYKPEMELRQILYRQNPGGEFAKNVFVTDIYTSSQPYLSAKLFAKAANSTS